MMRFGLTRHIWTLNSWPLPPFSEQCFHARPLPPPLHVAAHCSAAVFVQPSNTSVEQSWVCDKAETVANLLNHMDKKKEKKRKKYHCNSPFNPPPQNTTSPHPYTHLPAISTWLIVRFPVTQKQSGTSLLFFRWPNAFWIWCFKGKDSSLFTGCNMLSITKRPWGQQRNTACEVPANTPSNQRCDPQSSYKTSSSVSPWLCVWQV